MRLPTAWATLPSPTPSVAHATAIRRAGVRDAGRAAGDGRFPTAVRPAADADPAVPTPTGPAPAPIACVPTKPPIFVAPAPIWPPLPIAPPTPVVPPTPITPNGPPPVPVVIGPVPYCPALQRPAPHERRKPLNRPFRNIERRLRKQLPRRHPKHRLQTIGRVSHVHNPSNLRSSGFCSPPGFA